MNAACFKCACGMCECASDFAEDTCVELVTGCWVSSGQHVNLTALRKPMFGGMCDRREAISWATKQHVSQYCNKQL